MTERRERRWRIGLSFAAAVLAVVVVVSKQYDLVIKRTATSWQAGGSISRAAVFAAYSNRSGPAQGSHLGWSCTSQAVFGPAAFTILPRISRSLASQGTAGWSGALPLWPALVIIAGAAAWLWHRHRMWPAHLCRDCRYDLSGAAADQRGMCPECGAALRPPPA